MKALLISLIGIALICLARVGSAKLSKGDRNAITNDHNKKRVTLAHGKQKDKNGKFLPKGKNIYQLKYDLELERTAQEWADKCIWGHSSHHGVDYKAGENLFKTSQKSVPNKQVLLQASNAWWNEVIDMAWQPPKGRPAQGHFTQMAWDYTFAIGCGVSHCPDGTYVVCQYKQPGNNMQVPRIYEKGNPCKKHTDCTSPNSGKCNTNNGLCLYQGLYPANQKNWKPSMCQDHIDCNCDMVRIAKWCGSGSMVSCPKSVEKSGWCSTDKYCKRSCKKCK